MLFVVPGLHIPSPPSTSAHQATDRLESLPRSTQHEIRSLPCLPCPGPRINPYARFRHCWLVRRTYVQYHAHQWDSPSDRRPRHLRAVGMMGPAIRPRQPSDARCDARCRPLNHAFAFPLVRPSLSGCRSGRGEGEKEAEGREG